MDNLSAILLLFFIIGLFYNILKLVSKNSEKIRIIKALSYLIVLSTIFYYMVFVFGNVKP